MNEGLYRYLAAALTVHHDSTYLTILLKQKLQKRWPHCACSGLLRIFWHELHKCLSSKSLARIFFGNPGLLPSRDGGGEGSCAAMITPSRAKEWV